MSSHVRFRIQVDADPLDGGFIAKCPDLPGCISQGETRQEALENLVEAIAGVLEVRMQRYLDEHAGAEPPFAHIGNGGRGKTPELLEVLVY